MEYLHLTEPAQVSRGGALLLIVRLHAKPRCVFPTHHVDPSSRGQTANRVTVILVEVVVSVRRIGAVKDQSEHMGPACVELFQRLSRRAGTREAPAHDEQ